MAVICEPTPSTVLPVGASSERPVAARSSATELIVTAAVAVGGFSIVTDCDGIASPTRSSRKSIDVGLTTTSVFATAHVTTSWIAEPMYVPGVVLVSAIVSVTPEPAVAASEPHVTSNV